jgi:dTDP-glucose 4,6-dehydratase
MRSILVTGGAGFIGSHYLSLMLAAHPDYRIIILDKLTYAANKAYLSQAVQAAPERLEVVEGDLVQENFAEWLLHEYDCDLVVHFAAESHVERSVENPMLFWNSNAQGSAHLLEAARQKQVKRFLLVSSVEVYGPQAEGDPLWREEDMISPPTPYAAAKAAAERWAFAYWKSYDLPIVITRCCNNYGPRQHVEKQLPAFITAALEGKPLVVHGDGQHLRQWLYVKDHCRALDMLLHADEGKVVGEIFNIGGGPAAERTTFENAEAVLTRLGRDTQVITGPDRVPSIRRLALDSSKLEERLGWKPEVSFEEGLEYTLDFYSCAFSSRLVASQRSGASESDPLVLAAPAS